MSYFVIVIFALTSFSFVPTAFAGVGTACGSGGPNECGAGLTCQSNQCVLTGGSAGQPGNSGSGSAGQPGNANVKLINPLKADNLEKFLLDILDFVIQIGTIAVILMMVFVGYKFVTAQGKDAALTEARKALLYTVIGALILLGAKAISIGIQNTVKALSLALGN